MIIYPAIDLLDGQVVRLAKGDFATAKVYSADPIEQARNISSAGASWMHVVDLNGARDGKNAQGALIQKILSAASLNIQVGGGIRTLEQAIQWIEKGVKRVVVGSLAVTNPTATSQILKELEPSRVTLALDVKIANGVAVAATHGWKDDGGKKLEDLLNFYSDQGLEHLLCTDISRDGMLTGPNTELYVGLKQKFPTLQIQASGGISSLEDLKGLKEKGIHGAITGRALYEGRFTLEEALTC